ncbi:MAG: cytochrome c [Flavobacteriales bacterium]|mgnify:CR=1 FL=1|nr:cytochrome c [Flavobacteriales bacterium]
MRRRLLPLPAIVLLACTAGGSTEDPVMAEAHPDGTPNGTALFQMHCTLCHGKDGRLGLSGAKDLTLSVLTRDEVSTVVAGGKGKMVGYRNVLKPGELDAVVDHVMALRSATPSARP